MDKNKYMPEEIEAKWQKVWEENKTFSPDIKNSQNPYYNLMMFPYPSAEGLHVGNMYAFTGADVFARYNRMLGKDVLEPIGLDGFGIHSENYALKIGKHPLAQAEIAEKNFYRQMRSIGNSFDWNRTVETYDPGYYKWTQWLFIQLFKAGLAYRATALVNWCPKDLTVLSDEQVLDGSCERCGTKVEKRDLEQWFFRITNYADRLLNNIEGLKWTEKVKIAQRNWIGKSEGAEVEFVIASVAKQSDEIATSSLTPRNDVIKVFTTRPDTLYGATFMVLSPEHELVDVILNLFQNLKIPKQVRDDVSQYVENAKRKTEIERTGEGKEKTGVFSGLYAINPVNNQEIPIWIADYVLSGYGTGAIMAVPAHDARDFVFAKKYNLPIIEVIKNHESIINNQEIAEAYIGDGVLINSGEWDGLNVPREMSKVLDLIEEKGVGKRKANFHLRDWLISRQRYWGAPIPMIFCESCSRKGLSWFTTDEAKLQTESRIKKQELSENNHDSSFISHDSQSMAGWFSVPEEALPVMLPDVEDWKPMGTGKSPLANHPEFYNTLCPNCGGDAVRETDVSDTFLDSSWYFLRYPSVGLDKKVSKYTESDRKLEIGNLKLEIPWDPEVTRQWLPVDKYIGGAEHSVLHLLYSRFVTMVLKDLNFLDFEEPFSDFFAHGLIIKDGAKMSKSKGNVVVPDEYIGKYGADTLRTYLMFIGPYSEGGDFRDSGIEGMNKFLRKVWKLLSNYEAKPSNISDRRVRFMHKSIKKVTDDISTFSYNTAIASLMEWYNFLSADLRDEKTELNMEERGVYLHLLAPFAPHMSEELWQQGDSRPDKSKFISIHLSKWPEYDEKYLVVDTIVIPVQINGKRRAEVEISTQEIDDRSQIEKVARETISKHLEGIEVKKVIYVSGKIINFVI